MECNWQRGKYKNHLPIIIVVSLFFLVAAGGWLQKILCAKRKSKAAEENFHVPSGQVRQQEYT